MKKLPGMAPLDPKSLAMLNAMMPQPLKPQFIGGAAPRMGQSVNIQAPNYAIANAQATAQPSPPPTLASLLGMR
jgi:hypothetical protein